MRARDNSGERVRVRVRGHRSWHGGQIRSTVANGARVQLPASTTSSDSAGGLKKKSHHKLVLSLAGQTNYVRVGRQHRKNCDCLYFV